MFCTFFGGGTNGALPPVAILYHYYYHQFTYLHENAYYCIADGVGRVLRMLSLYEEEAVGYSIDFYCYIDNNKC
jgi:hypothetical protein